MNLIVDIETTGVTPGCVVLSVAVLPATNLIKPLHIYIQHEIQRSYALCDDKETMEFWNTVPKEVQELAFSGQVHPIDAVNKIIQYVALFDNCHYWSKGKDFDFPILRKFLNTFGCKEPWTRHNIHCLRDLAMWANIEWPTPSEKHNALSDAIDGLTVLEQVKALKTNDNRTLFTLPD